jgi:hypothetical protein
MSNESFGSKLWKLAESVFIGIVIVIILYYLFWGIVEMANWVSRAKTEAELRSRKRVAFLAGLSLTLLMQWSMWFQDTPKADEMAEVFSASFILLAFHLYGLSRVMWAGSAMT